MIPAPVSLAHEIAPSLAGLDWGIGGSVLMWSLGLEPAPRDLDVIASVDDFVAIREQVARRLGAPTDVSHATYQSQCFARFAIDGPVSMDLFAGIRVKTEQGLVAWTFDPHSVIVKQGLPWMRPADWVELYTIFDRPHRARALQDYLASEAAAAVKNAP